MEACGGAGSEQAEERWTDDSRQRLWATQRAQCCTGAGPSGPGASLHRAASAHRHCCLQERSTSADEVSMGERWPAFMERAEDGSLPA